VDSGRAYVFSGATGALLRVCSSPLPEAGGQFGFAVAGSPDLNGDGRGDVVIGAWGEDAWRIADSGRTYVFSGATGATLHAVGSGQPTVGGAFGRSVAAVPLPGGRARLLVGARGETTGPGGPAVAGAAYLFRPLLPP
jgi:hypothetical protein